MPGFVVLGLAVPGFAVLGFAVLGFAVLGLPAEARHQRGLLGCGVAAREERGDEARELGGEAPVRHQPTPRAGVGVGGVGGVGVGGGGVGGVGVGGGGGAHREVLLPQVVARAAPAALGQVGGRHDNAQAVRAEEEEQLRVDAADEPAQRLALVPLG